MATANTALRVTELDFDNIRTNLKEYLRSQQEFQDFDFDGSGMSVLIDLLAYNTHYMGYYLNTAANEMFIDTAQLRNSVVSHAKLIGYTPRTRTGATAVVNVRVTPSQAEDANTNILTLDKYSRFLGTDINGINYNFLTTTANSTAKVDGSFFFGNVSIKQGEVVTRQYLMDPYNTKRRFSLPTANVDIDTISVVVQESTSNTDMTTYTLVDDITTIDGNSPVFFFEEEPNANYAIYFGDGVLGRKPKVGNIINVTYLDTTGTSANSIPRFTSIGGIGSFSDNVSVTTVMSSFGATEKETVEQIKFRAPYAYVTQNRAVSTQDYETLILKDYPNLDAVSVWGGEDNDPPIYGKVFISLKTKEGYYLTNAEKESVKELLIRNRNVLTVIPEIVDPSFTFLLIRGTVYYNPSRTQMKAAEISALVRAAIADYKEKELDRFNATFKKSRLQYYVENSDKSVTASDLKIYLQKRVSINPSVVSDYKITVDTPIKKGDYVNKLSSFPALNVNDSSGISRQVFFEEVPAAFTGVDSISIINPGINFSSTPTITITGDGTGATAVAKVVSNRIAEITVTNKGLNYTRAIVSIIGGGGSEASAVARLQSKFGNLRTYYFKDTGEKVIVNADAGTINYETGEIVLKTLATTGTVTNDFYGENQLVFNLPVDNEVISKFRNRIMTIDLNDPLSIQYEVMAEK